MVTLARENRSWGYDRIAGTQAELGYKIGDQTVGNILKRRGIPIAPSRKTTTTWAEFIRTHMAVLWATDFFTIEVWMFGGLVTYYVLFFIKLDTREVHIAGVTSHPNAAWMRQIARNLTMDGWGMLKRGQYLIHDRDTKFCTGFKQILDDALSHIHEVLEMIVEESLEDGSDLSDMEGVVVTEGAAVTITR